MRQIRAWLIRFRGLFGQSRRAREFTEELESHLQMHTEDGIRSGLSPAEARRRAILKLGGIEPAKESYRDRLGIPFLEKLARDVGYSFRMMRRRLGFTAAVVLTLALGIGATTAIFTVVRGVLLRPLPYPEPERLVYIGMKLRGLQAGPFAYTDDFISWKNHSRTLSQVAAYMWESANLTGGGEAERVSCGTVSASLFPLLGVQPILGRTFLPEEDRPAGPPVAILSHALWKRRFGGDATVAGKQITLDDRSYTIVGVLPAGFQIPDQFTDFGYGVWLPFADGAGNWTPRSGRPREILARVVGRLKPGVSIEAARAELEALQVRAVRRGVRWKSVTVQEWHEQIVRGARRSLLVLFFAVGFVLLIACVNVANLLLSRGASREKEIAVRLAQGAPKSRVVRQLLTESLMLGLLGGAAGLALAVWGKKLLISFLSPNLPTLDAVRLDYPVLFFNLGLAILTGLAFGVAPALQASRIPVSESLKEAGSRVGEGRASARLRNLLVVVEIALALVLLTGGGLLVKSFLKLRGVETGFQPGHVLTLGIDLTPSKYPKAAERTGFFQQVLARVRSLRGVESAGVATCPPLGSRAWTISGLEIEGQTPIEASVYVNAVSADYFRSMGIPLLRGRYFMDYDREGSPGVLLVNDIFARQFFPKTEPIGRRIANWAKKNDWLTITGVVGSVRSDPAREPEPEIYSSYLQSAGAAYRATMTLLVRTTEDPMKLAAAVRAQIANVDKSQPPHHVMTLEEAADRSLVSRRVFMTLFGAFAGVALALALIGIYGVVSYSVGQRTHEIGVRMALGARQAEILGMVLRNGLVLISAGVVIGLLASAGLTRLIANQLWGVSATDPWTFLVVAVALAASGLAACVLPARRAAKVNPMVALRNE